jgi:hypothetical protein
MAYQLACGQKQNQLKLSYASILFHHMQLWAIKIGAQSLIIFQWLYATHHKILDKYRKKRKRKSVPMSTKF